MRNETTAAVSPAISSRRGRNESGGRCRKVAGKKSLGRRKRRLSQISLKQPLRQPTPIQGVETGATATRPTFPRSTSIALALRSNFVV